MSEDLRRPRTSMTVLEITQNLFEALLQLRDVSKTRTLWIDAVCIDQANQLERGEQVQIMRAIYEHATRVLIWLGPEDDETAAAIAMIAKLKDHVTSRGLSLEALKALKSEDPFTETLGLKEHAYSAGSLVALRNLYRRPWFQRIWVVQEVTAGGSDSEIHIGSHVIPWDDLGVASLWLDALLWDSALPLEGGTATRNARIMWQGYMIANQTPPPLLDEARTFLATDPRDLVYALFGFPALQTLSKEFDFRPNYTISLRDLFELVTLLAMKSSKTLEVLHYIDHSILADDEPTWPSWIPRWDRPISYWAYPFQDYEIYKSAPQGVLTLAEHSQGGILELKGVKIDYVSDTAQHITWKSTSDGMILENTEDLAQFWDDILRHSGSEELRSHPNLIKDLLAGLAQALTGGLDADYNSAAKMSPRHTADAIDFLLHSFNNSSPSDRSKPSSSLQDHLISLQLRYPQGDRLRYQKDIFWLCENRRLFHTHNGRFGLGPLAVQPGDIVAILFGGYTPFVLSPRDDCFLLVGECYLNDMMDEQALELCRLKSGTGKLEERIFRLK